MKYTVAPQLGQKWNVACPPESPARVNAVDAPWIVTRSAAQRACWPKGLPVRRWQAVQWQSETRIGSPSQVIASLPQLHSARRVVMRSS